MAFSPISFDLTFWRACWLIAAVNEFAFAAVVLPFALCFALGVGGLAASSVFCSAPPLAFFGNGMRAMLNDPIGQVLALAPAQVPCQVKGTPPSIVQEVHVRSFADKELDDVSNAGAGGQVKRRAALVNLFAEGQSGS